MTTVLLWTHSQVLKSQVSRTSIDDVKIVSGLPTMSPADGKYIDNGFSAPNFMTLVNIIYPINTPNINKNQKSFKKNMHVIIFAKLLHYSQIFLTFDTKLNHSKIEMGIIIWQIEKQHCQ